jgi:hypothetical protein
MAGHFPLRKQDEPKLFELVEIMAMRFRTFNKALADFSRKRTSHIGKQYSIKKLSKEYVESPETEAAFTLGKVTLEQDFDVDQWLATNCDVEVHMNKTTGEVINIFFVA